MEKSEITLHSKPVYIDHNLDDDTGYIVHPDVYDVIMQGYQCIMKIPDRIREIVDLYERM